MAKRSWWLDLQGLATVGLLAQTIGLPRRMQDGLVDWEAAPKTAPLPPATVIVPARNEERVIERCVRSLLAQDHPDYELIVVDDGSTDATPQILDRLAAENSRLKVVHLREELPPGWAGKPHAMQRGYEAARPESRWILFSDADTCHEPMALSRTISLAEREKGDLLSLLPRMELLSFWEKLMMPYIVMGIMMQYPTDKVNLPNSPLAIANGQFLLIRRTMYEKVGGYGGALKNSLLDDRDMALAVKQQGGRLLLKDGRGLVAVRMYTNLAEIWHGFSKNAFVGSRWPYVSIPFFIVAGLSVGFMPALQLFYALARWIFSGGKKSRKLLSYSLLELSTASYVLYRFQKEMDVEAPYALLSPLAVLVFSGVMADSMARALTKRGVSWKGRNYSDAAKTQQILKY